VHAGPKLFRALLVLIAMAICSSLARAQDTTTFFRIGTGPAADTLYALGSSIAAGITNPPGSLPCRQGGSCGVPGLIAVAQTKSGSIENLKAVGGGEIESALVHSDMAYWAYNGMQEFEGVGAMSNLRAIANLFPVWVHVVVAGESDISTIRDLDGKRVSLGPEASGTASNALYVLRSHGLSPSQIDTPFLNPGPAADALNKGEIDAFFVVGGAPVQAIATLAEKMPIRLLPIRDAETQQLLTLYPFFSFSSIPAGTYEGVEMDVPSVSLGVLWVVTSEQDDLFIRNATRALWSANTARFLRTSHPEGALVTVERARQNLSIPLHDGATAFYDSLEMTN